jgi:hypothetical protein
LNTGTSHAWQWQRPIITATFGHYLLLEWLTLNIQLQLYSSYFVDLKKSFTVFVFTLKCLWSNTTELRLTMTNLRCNGRGIQVYLLRYHSPYITGISNQIRAIRKRYTGNISEERRERLIKQFPIFVSSLCTSYKSSYVALISLTQ